jgi:hypothetical protein
MTDRTPMIEVADLKTLIGKYVVDQDGTIGMVVNIDTDFFGGDFPITVAFKGRSQWNYYTADGYLHKCYANRYYYGDCDDRYIKLV